MALMNSHCKVQCFHSCTADELMNRIIDFMRGMDIFKAFLMMFLSGKSLKLIATSFMFLVLIGNNGRISISKCL